jgi:HlyD family secretion protein
MPSRLRVVVLLTFFAVLGCLPQSMWDASSSNGSLLIPAAQAKSNLRAKVRTLLNRVLGETTPEGIVKTNGRIEATQVDVSAKYPGRLAEVNVEEGDSVTTGQVVGRITSPEYEAQLRAASSNVQRAKDALAGAEANIAQHNSVLVSAKADFERGQQLIDQKIITQQTFDQRRRNYEASLAGVQEATAGRDSAQSAVKAADAEVERIESVLKDMVLVSPRTGRVQYLTLRTGEVAAAGGRIMTILDLNDVYMTIFLPAGSAGKLEMRGEARIILDPVPQYVIPATISFVATDAQFTPKTVETADERQKLMFRIKLQLDPQVLKKYASRVKTGVRGIGIVRTDPAVAWPDDLQVKLPK